MNFRDNRFAPSRIHGMLTHALAIFVALSTAHSVQAGNVEIREDKGRLEILCLGKPFATYVYEDSTIPRPYFADVHAPSCDPVTRNNPPIEGQDKTDHATYHPGIWMAFGDVSGTDFWRNKARVVHEKFVTPPVSGDPGSFVAINRYESDAGVIMHEQFECTITSNAETTRIQWKSTFTPEKEIFFGDQEEMGLGVRLATPLIVEKGGVIENSDGKKNEKEVWGQTATWCAYSGEVAGIRTGIILVPSPSNFRASWFHARDYGLLVANPFGQNAFTNGEASKVVVSPEKPLTLAFDIVVFHSAKPIGELAQSH